jgi:hypothetical protein
MATAPLRGHRYYRRRPVLTHSADKTRAFHFGGLTNTAAAIVAWLTDWRKSQSEHTCVIPMSANCPTCVTPPTHAFSARHGASRHEPFTRAEADESTADIAGAPTAVMAMNASPRDWNRPQRDGHPLSRPRPRDPEVDDPLWTVHGRTWSRDRQWQPESGQEPKADTDSTAGTIRPTATSVRAH